MKETGPEIDRDRDRDRRFKFVNSVHVSVSVRTFRILEPLQFRSPFELIAEHYVGSSADPTLPSFGEIHMFNNAKAFYKQI